MSIENAINNKKIEISIPDSIKSNEPDGSYINVHEEKTIELSKLLLETSRGFSIKHIKEAVQVLVYSIDDSIVL